MRLPSKGTVLITVANPDKSDILRAAKDFDKMRLRIIATEGTHQFLKEHGIKSELVLKMHEGRPNILDTIKNALNQKDAKD